MEKSKIISNIGYDAIDVKNLQKQPGNVKGLLI
jgi:hypothetical protein